MIQSVPGRQAGNPTLEIDVNESMAHPNRFLADLTQAMRLTAETARQATLEQCVTDAKEYEDRLGARTADEAGKIRRAAEADVATIREQSRAQMELVRAETDHRVSRRREVLENALDEFTAAVDQEIEAVTERVSAFENEVTVFFERLLEDADPATFTRMASQLPEPPTFADLGPDGLADVLRARREAAEGAAPEVPLIAAEEAAPEVPLMAAEEAAPEEPQTPTEAHVPTAEQLPDHWWMDSPAALVARMQEETPN